MLPARLSVFQDDFCTHGKVSRKEPQFRGPRAIVVEDEHEEHIIRTAAAMLGWNCCADLDPAWQQARGRWIFYRPLGLSEQSKLISKK